MNSTVHSCGSISATYEAYIPTVHCNKERVCHNVIVIPYLAKTVFLPINWSSLILLKNFLHTTGSYICSIITLITYEHNTVSETSYLLSLLS